MGKVVGGSTGRYVDLWQGADLVSLTSGIRGQRRSDVMARGKKNSKHSVESGEEACTPEGADAESQKTSGTEESRGGPKKNGSIFQAIVLGMLPVIIIVAILAFLDYSASRIYYMSVSVGSPGGSSDEEDADEDFYTEGDQRFYEFSPYDNYSSEVFQSKDIVNNWIRLDPMVKTRIWLHYLYPIERQGRINKSTETAKVLISSGLSELYPTTVNPVELFSRSVGDGRSDDFISFLENYNACVKIAKCSLNNLKVQVSALVQGAYVFPAYEMIMSGQCSRALVVTKNGLKILESLDLSRADDSSEYNALRILAAISEHPSCVKDYSLLKESLGEDGCCYRIGTDLSKVPDQFSSIRLYGKALSHFESADYVSAVEMLEKVAALGPGSISELAKFMKARAVFWSFVYSKKNDLFVDNHAEDVVPNFLPLSLSESRGEIEKIRAAIRSRSLISDIDEYQLELLKYED
ncbi:MAG: hypothetical protein JNM58_14950 [Xanthomonadaceae bacterium]|nr:hypothetical protein [Xanthomonadaceae bacterium]